MLTKLSVVVVLLLCFNAEAHAADPSRRIPKRPSVERSIRVTGFRGKISVRDVPSDKVAIEVRTASGVTYDTVVGHGVYPVSVHGRKEWFYAGKFSDSNYPMLIFAVGDPDHAEDSKVYCYQLSSTGVLIGQQVVVDENMQHGHSEEVSGGRYQLTAIDPSVGAIYSIAYQDARFEGFYVAYEKIHVRQWDQTINSFIETDQGFLREHSGKPIHSSQFHSLSDSKREEIFLANVEPARPKVIIRWVAPRLNTASIQR